MTGCCRVGQRRRKENTIEAKRASYDDGTKVVDVGERGNEEKGERGSRAGYLV